MGKIVLGLILGLVIGIGCRCFGIPLPGPPKIIGALVVLAVTLGYVGADNLLARHTKASGQAKVSGGFSHPGRTGNCCGGPTGLPSSRERTSDRSNR